MPCARGSMVATRLKTLQDSIPSRHTASKDGISHCAGETEQVINEGSVEAQK